MRTTQTLLGTKARNAILKGVNAIYEPVKLTLGPEGRNALLYRAWNRGNRITNDGYTVAQCQRPKDIFERQAAETFSEACSKTNERVGDGTTTTVVIGGKLYNDAHHLLLSNTSSLGGGGKKIGVRALKRKILETAEIVKTKIKEQAQEVRDLQTLERIAITSTGNEELGKMVASMAWKVGVDGFLDVVEGFKTEIETEVMNGMRFHAKVVAKGFLNNPAKFEMVAKDCAVVITNYELLDPVQVAKVLNPILEANGNNLIVIAPTFSNAVSEDWFKAMHVINPDGTAVRKPGLNIYPVAVPSLRTEVLKDIAIFCGANLIDKTEGRKFESMKPTDAGFLEKLVVKDVEAKDDAIAIGGKGTREVEKVDFTEVEVKKNHKDGTEYTAKEKVSMKRMTTEVADRIKELKGQLEETQTETFKNLLRRRIGGMSSSVGVIRVGDTTRASSLYNKLKIEDAVYACKAALRMGYVKGGGLCLKEIAEDLEDDDILKAALMEPYKLIQASFDESLEIGDDVIDPAEVPYYAVDHATGVVANLITVDVITPETENPLTGEGEYAIARALRELTDAHKIHYGQIKEADAGSWRDAMGGLTTEEYVDENEDI